MGEIVRLRHNNGAVSLSLQFREERASKWLTPTYIRADRLRPDGYILYVNLQTLLHSPNVSENPKSRLTPATKPGLIHALYTFTYLHYYYLRTPQPNQRRYAAR